MDSVGLYLGSMTTSQRGIGVGDYSYFASSDGGERTGLYAGAQIFPLPKPTTAAVCLRFLSRVVPV